MHRFWLRCGAQPCWCLMYSSSLLFPLWQQIMLPCDHLLPTPAQKHHSFWSVWLYCSHVISIWAAAAGPLVICSTHIRLWADFYQLIRWCLTHRFDQTVHRVCPASTVKSTAPWCVSVLPPVSIALPRSTSRSNIHTDAHTQCVIFAKTVPLPSLNNKQVYHLCFKWFFHFRIVPHHNTIIGKHKPNLLFSTTKLKNAIKLLFNMGYFFQAEFASWVCCLYMQPFERVERLLNKNSTSLE